MAYKSKIDLSLIILIYGIITGVILPMLIIDFSWFGLGLLVSILALVSIPLFGIRYIIEGTTLNVKTSFFSKKAYDINDMVEITATRNPLSAPATSLDRISIKFSHRYMPLLLSPQDKDTFANVLKSINPNIQIKF